MAIWYTNPLYHNGKGLLTCHVLFQELRMLQDNMQNCNFKHKIVSEEYQSHLAKP